MRQPFVGFVAFLALQVFGPAAQAGRAYVGASYLEAGAELDVQSVVDDFDEDDSGFKFWAGYRHGRYLDFEGGYYDLGEPDSTLMFAGDFAAEISAWNLAARVKFPVGERIELFARAGVFLWDVELTGANLDDEDDGTDLGYGAGIAVLVSRVELRVEYENVEFDDLELDVVSAGVGWRF